MNVSVSAVGFFSFSFVPFSPLTNPFFCFYLGEYCGGKQSFKLGERIDETEESPLLVYMSALVPFCKHARLGWPRPISQHETWESASAVQK